MDVEEAKERLREYLLKGIVTEILHADEAYSLVVEIGKHAKQINAANYGELFGSLQLILSDRQTLSIAKIFEPVGGYPTRSIPVTLALLEKHANLWEVAQPQQLHRALTEASSDILHVEQLCDAELTHAVVAHFRANLPDPKRVEPHRLSLSLGTLLKSRNKAISHNKAIELSALQETTWGEATALVNYAKESVATIAFGYLSIFSGIGSDDYIPKHYARHTSNDLRRLLKAANIAADTRS